MFSGECRAYMAKKSRIGSPAGQEVRARSGEAQDAIGTAADHIRIGLILSIVLPPADGAELEDSRSGQRPASAAKATHIYASHTRLRRGVQCWSYRKLS